MNSLFFVVLLLTVGCADPAPAPSAPTPPAPVADVIAAPSPAPTAAAAPVRYDLNTASEEDLAKVPGAGAKMVHEFVEYRPYVSIEQFRRAMAKYVDAPQIQAYETHLYVPIAPNDCDVATLQQLPGVDAAVAETLVAGRPYASNEAFLAKLGAIVTAEQAAAAKTLLKP